MARDPVPKLVKAALDLAAEHGWRDLELSAIAERAKVPLADLVGVVAGRDDILAHFMRRIDREVIATIDPEVRSEPPRDRLFEVLMRRFELLEPHKKALKRIAEDLSRDPGALIVLFPQTLASHYWMLTAADIPADGVRGLVRAKGAALIYCAAFRVWLDDDDPGLARTMAALDRAVRRAETWMGRAAVPIGLASAFARFACAVIRPPRRTEPAGEGGQQGGS